MEIVASGVEFSFEVTFDADDLDVGAEIYDVTSGTPAIVGAAFALENIPGSNTYFGQFTPVLGKEYVIIKSVYTDGTLTTRSPDYAQGSEAVTAREDIEKISEFCFEVTFDADDLDVGAEIYDLSTGTPALVGSAFAMENIPGSNTYFGQFVPVAGKQYSIIKSVYTDNTLATRSPDYAQGSESVPAARGNNSTIDPSYVRHGIAYTQDGVDYVGTYRGYDLWNSALAEQLAFDVHLLQDGITVIGTAAVTAPPSIRSVLNSILAFIGASSLTDDEFDDLSLTLSSPAIEVYTALSEVLEAREAISLIIDRLRYYFLAKGVSVPDADVGKSQIFLGAALC